MANSEDQRAEALRRIEEAARTGATELDLHGLGLTKLPREIGELTELKRLNLSENGLTVVPRVIGKLTNLAAC